jgi:dTDP-glucose 4,6-dehydratase
MWFKPDSPFLPNNPYAASKAAQDCYLRSMEHTFGMNVVTVRMANQFGSWQHPEKMLPATIGRILSNQSIKIYGEGKNIRQWTPVSQTVNHIRNILETENATTIHLGADQSLLTNNSVVEMWRKIMLYKYRIESKVEYIIDRKGHDKMYAIQPTLKYAYTNLDKEFEETLAHYVDREEHYKRE